MRNPQPPPHDASFTQWRADPIRRAFVAAAARLASRYAAALDLRDPQDVTAHDLDHLHHLYHRAEQKARDPRRRRGCPFIQLLPPPFKPDGL